MISFTATFNISNIYKYLYSSYFIQLEFEIDISSSFEMEKINKFRPKIMIEIRLNATFNAYYPRQGGSPVIPGTTRIQASWSGRIPSWTETGGFQVGWHPRNQFRNGRLDRRRPRYPTISIPHEFVERKCRVLSLHPLAPPPFRYLDGVQKWFASNEATLFQRDVPFLPVARVNIGRNSREKRLVSEGVESCFRCTFAFDDFPGDIQRICPLPSNIMFDHRADRIFIFFFCCAAMWRV